ncbi:hypothetical protein [Altericista sp. CCNU0014]|uniref:hypothetical protein n=1 Tax=Altericista sp. CCNU0014 TaxID=3082949 RepID=UPI00384E939B
MDIGLLQSAAPFGFQSFLFLDIDSYPLISGSIWIAQAVRDDLFNNVGQSWNNFIQSGQVWALGIGFVVGYLFRGLTSS